MSLFAPPFSIDLPFTIEERLEIRRRTKQLVARRRLSWLLVAALVAILPAMAWLAPVVVRALDERGLPPILGVWLTSLSALVGIGGVAFIAFHPIRRKAYREAVRELGYPVCVECGHVLQKNELSSERCPACRRMR